MGIIRVAIAGYGNLGRGAQCAIDSSEDMVLVGVFTRRDPSSLRILSAGVPVRDYFADYDTTVSFISEEEMAREHSGLPHGGTVLHSGKVGWDTQDAAVLEFTLKLESNPEFTAVVLVAYAWATYRLARQGQISSSFVSPYL